MPPLLLPAEKVLFASEALRLLSGGREGDAGREPTRWARTNALGAILTPLVGTHSQIFFATDTRGVICLGSGTQ